MTKQALVGICLWFISHVERSGVSDEPRAARYASNAVQLLKELMQIQVTLIGQ